MRVRTGTAAHLPAEAPLCKDKLPGRRLGLLYSEKQILCPIQALFGLPSCRFSRQRLWEIPEVNSKSDHQPETVLKSLVQRKCLHACMPGCSFADLSLSKLLSLLQLWTDIHILCQLAFSQLICDRMSCRVCANLEHAAIWQDIFNNENKLWFNK